MFPALAQSNVEDANVMFCHNAEDVAIANDDVENTAGKYIAEKSMGTPVASVIIKYGFSPASVAPLKTAGGGPDIPRAYGDPAVGAAADS